MNTEDISQSNFKSLIQTAMQKQKSGQLDEAEKIYIHILQILQNQPEHQVDLQQMYGQMIGQLMARYYAQWSQPIGLPNLAINEKIRVGFISGFFRDHSTWKIPARGWVENLDRSEFELFGYHTGSKRDQETVRAAKAFDKFTQGPLQFEQWAEAIQQDQLHVLIFPEFGIDPMTIRLGCLRLAPVQITSWGHSDTSGLPTILGNALHAQGKLSPEKKFYYAQLNYKLGVSRRKAGDLKTAVAYYRSSIAIQPDLVDAHYNLGVALQELGELSEARACYQKALEFNPQHSEAYASLAQAHSH